MSAQGIQCVASVQGVYRVKQARGIQCVEPVQGEALVKSVQGIQCVASVQGVYCVKPARERKCQERNVSGTAWGLLFETAVGFFLEAVRFIICLFMVFTAEFSF